MVIPSCASALLSPGSHIRYRKKNAPYLYDVVITHALDWPSLTCQWFPDKESYVALHPRYSHTRPNGPQTCKQAVYRTSRPPWDPHVRTGPRLPPDCHRTPPKTR